MFVNLQSMDASHQVTFSHHEKDDSTSRFKCPELFCMSTLEGCCTGVYSSCWWKRAEVKAHTDIDFRTNEPSYESFPQIPYNFVSLLSLYNAFPPPQKIKFSFWIMDCFNTHFPLLFPTAFIKLSSFWIRNAVASYRVHSSFFLSLFYTLLTTTGRLLNSTQGFILLWHPPWATAILLQRVGLCYVYVMTQGQC